MKMTDEMIRLGRHTGRAGEYSSGLDIIGTFPPYPLPLSLSFPLYFLVSLSIPPSPSLSLSLSPPLTASAKPSLGIPLFRIPSVGLRTSQQQHSQQNPRALAIVPCAAMRLRLTAGCKPLVNSWNPPTPSPRFQTQQTLHHHDSASPCQWRVCRVWVLGGLSGRGSGGSSAAWRSLFSASPYLSDTRTRVSSHISVGHIERVKY